MKIKNLQVENFKAIENVQMTFEGCHAIVTGKNGAGKSTALRGLIDRIRGSKAEVQVKEGEKNGDYYMELTDGSRIEWNFTAKSEKFAYITPEGIKQTTGVIKAIGEKVFGIPFDIDKFLNMQPAKQSKELQKLVGLDFSEIDGKIETAREQRKDSKKELERIAAQRMDKPQPVDTPDTEAILQKLADIRKDNEMIEWEARAAHETELKEVRAWNEKAHEKRRELQEMKYERESLKNAKYFSKHILFDAINAEIDGYEVPEEKPEPVYTAPTLTDTSALEKELNDANYLKGKAENYQAELERYNGWVESGKAARKEVEVKEAEVKELEEQKREMINGAAVPEEFQFTSDGILYNGLPLTREQQATSALYIAALKLGAMGLGELKTLHFDASTLDNDNLKEVLKWADANDLQLLIERPAYEGGGIKYEIIEK